MEENEDISTMEVFEELDETILEEQPIEEVKEGEK